MAGSQVRIQQLGPEAVSRKGGRSFFLLEIMEFMIHWMQMLNGSITVSA